ncbi:ABC transporter ATP-binding protein [Thermomicrobiaceae bacterium CFH 74404]|uniref:ABC transporter ATP-binding protein n=1 Tax=Thermalbibacter longus TaxID=2951981 RepID=A0AA41WAK8_9BACT|nr:ABC transporter ATP-binding protein [Thermalbibacter longus]MCM8747757.1 ABC transporter ATP-binding protein [Thermalbibacter longus]
MVMTDGRAVLRGRGTRDERVLDTVLRVEGLTKRYGRRVAVQGLALKLRRGEVLGLLGPNGAGKTTAIAMILGLVRPDAGTIEILGVDATRERERALRRVGAIIESPSFYPYLSGIDNLRVLALARGGVPERRFAEVLELVGLTGRERERVSSYSLGMRQRLAIAGALLHQPELLILDEPTNGLDPQGMAEIRQLILRLAAEGQTILLCSHLLYEVQQVCDRVVILSQGQVVAEGDVEELLAQRTRTALRVDDPPRAIELLSEVEWIERIEQEGDLLLLTMPSERQFELSALLHAHGIAVGELRVQSRTLEEFFLDVTGPSTTPGGRGVA